MWKHRNNHLHGNKASIPEVDRKAIDNEVSNEWNIDNLMLAVHHRHLFNGSLEERLSKSYHIKRVWLASVWAACETTDINHLKNNQIQTDTTIRLRYEQWKKRYQCDILD